MCTGVTMFRRQRIVFHLVFLLVLNKLHGSSSTYGWPLGCDEYPEVCSGEKEKESHNNCTITPENQIGLCHYSQNDSLQQRDLFSSFEQHDDIPESPNNFSVNVYYIRNRYDLSCMPALTFSWKMPPDAKSMKWLTGFALNISYAYNNKNRQRVRIFSVESKLSNDAVFKYECFRAMPGVKYRATIYSLPTNLQNIVTQTVSVNCSTPYVQRPTRWKAVLDVSVLINGSISVYFMPAPFDFNFSVYSAWLSIMSPREDRCREIRKSPTRVTSLCPEQGHIVINPTGVDVHKDFSVCVQPCVSCTVTPFHYAPPLVISPIVAIREETTELNVNATTVINPDGVIEVLPDGAIVPLVGLLPVVLLVFILCVWIYRKRSYCHKKGVNATKKYVFLVYGNEVKLYFTHVIERLSAFLELCYNYEVISSDSCNSVPVLMRRIALADSVLIISAPGAVSRYAVSTERSDSGLDSETTPVGDIFDSAIEIIKRNFQTGVSYMKFCQIILPRCHDGSPEVGLLDLKVKKTYQLMEFIEELWGNNQIMPSISDSNADDFRKCYEVFKKLERATGSTNCWLQQCGSCRIKSCQHNYERNVYKQSFSDSGITVDDSFASFLAEAPLPQCCCTGLSDTKSQMTNRNSHCHFMCRNADHINCSLSEIEPQHENTLQSTVQCKLLQCSQKEIDLTLDDYFFFESKNSSSEAISLSSFYSTAVKLNAEFDKNLEADGIDDERAIRIY